MRKFIFTLTIIGSLYSCSSDKTTDETSVPENIYEPVTITTTSMEFEAPDSISSGWQKFIYDNQSGDIHFFVFEKLPDGITLADYKQDIVTVFERALDLMDEGKIDEGFQEFEKIPEWFSRVQNVGGVSLIGPQQKADATFYLEPGRYAMECYVRMPNGRPHALMGMLDEIVVLNDTSILAEPSADLEIAISIAEGLVFQDKVSSGKHTFGVNFIDQMKYENMMGHDVNLVRMEPGYDPAVLAEWMNSADPMAFRTPAPAGFDFIGGIQELPAGQFGYFSATLIPGSYILISEIPGSVNRKMMSEFTVVQ